MSEYNHKKIENKWQKVWEKNKVYKAKDFSKKPKYFSLIEFPYPSGAGLHVGHIRSNTAMDIISRKRRMEGFNVLYPIGWDAFGLPTENYAIKTGKDPRIVTKKNTDIFRRQLKNIGFSFDWSREINTTDPKYYKWTQWIFLQFLKKGLAYKAKININWCPKDKTGLANEEVVNGCCERCGTPVEKREKEQWMLAITKYAERLDKDLDYVDYLPKIKLSQRNWIGKSEGAEIEFKINTTYPLSPSQREGEINYLILPGWESGENDHFYKWIENELKPAKFQIVKWQGIATEKWVDLVLNNYDINKNTIVVGHSLGVAVGMKVIERLNYHIAGFVSVAGFIEPKFKDHNRPFINTFNWNFDFKKIKEKIGFVKVLSDKNDYTIPLSQGKILAQNLEGELIEIVAKKPHFTGNEEIEILECILNITHPLTPSQREGEFGYHTTDPKTWRFLQDRVLEMRKNPTPAEEKLWKALKGNSIDFHFRRQQIVGNFVVDFVCLSKNLVVEVDGDIHDYKKQEDKDRTEFLNANGFRVIRFANNEVLNNLNNVLKKIDLELKALPFGEGLGGVESDSVKVFTTRPDTVFGATYLVLAPEHKLVSDLKSQITNWAEVEKYIKEVKNKTDIERMGNPSVGSVQTKTGVELKGIKAINPATKEEIPVWIADYVLATYGTGAIMAVPAHDERDFEFAKKFKIPIKQVVVGVVRPTEYPIKEGLPFVYRDAVMCVIKHWEKDEYLCQEWKDFSEVRTLISGGIEQGEDAVIAGKREILEESGYTNAKFVRQLGGFSYLEFYHQRKKENRRVRFRYLYFELENGDKVDISEEENNQHTLLWKKPNEVVDFLNIGEKEKIWERFNGKEEEQVFTGAGYLVNSGKFDGQYSETAKKEIIKFVGGKEKTTFKLRDWVFSRQRYWGEPIPVIHCEKCGIIPVPEHNLPVELPKVKNYQPTDSGESPLANISKWVNTKCPKCKGKAKRETDTMPNWAGSSWYYLRYTDPKNSKAFSNKKNLKYWLGSGLHGGVDWYNGGNEHTTLHLLYSRFWHKFLFDLKLVPTAEPYKKRTSHGMILGEGGVKMSKSLGNVINPDDIVKIYGADTLRIYEMFMGPFSQSVAWSTESIIGSRRFIEKVWRIQYKLANQSKNLRGPRSSGAPHPGQTITNYSPDSLVRLLSKTIKKVSEDIEEMRFNTAISSMMILATEMEKAEIVKKEDYLKFLQILSPFAPHISEELWSFLGEKKSINFSKWPKSDESLLVDEEIKIVVQVNGKVKIEMMISQNDNEEDVKNKALSSEGISKHIVGKDIKKIIYVKNRLINIVL